MRASVNQRAQISIVTLVPGIFCIECHERARREQMEPHIEPLRHHLMDAVKYRISSRMLSALEARALEVLGE